MRNLRGIITILITAVVAVMSFTAVAGANQRFLPNGINSVSPLKAKTQVMQYADVNDEYGDMLAREAGRSSFSRNEWVQRGYSKAPANTWNSSLTPAGSPSKQPGAVGTKTLVLVNIRTSRVVHVMVRCGNPRLSKSGKCDCKPVSIRKVNKIRIYKRFKKTVTKKCPSGQPVTVTVSGVAKGWVKATVWAKVIGSAKIKIKNEIALAVSAKITVECGTPPPPPPPPASPPGVDQNIAQDCKIHGKIWDAKVMQCVAINIVCGVVVIGDNNTVNSDNCNDVKPPPTCEETHTCPIPPPPPPKCPDGRPVPENGDCDRPPSITITSIPHLMAPNAEGRGAENGDVYMETSDPDGDVQNADVEVVSGGEFANWSSLHEISTRWNNTSCPSGKTCWKFTLWAKAPGNFQFRGVVSAGGKTVKSAISTVEVQPYQF